MAINYQLVNDEIVKIAKGLGYDVEMFDEMASGPISSTKNVKYLKMQPDNIMMSLTDGEFVDHDEIVLYVGKITNQAKFVNFLKRIKIRARFNGLGVTIRKYNEGFEPIKFLSAQAKARREEATEE